MRLTFYTSVEQIMNNEMVLHCISLRLEQDVKLQQEHATRFQFLQCLCLSCKPSIHCQFALCF